MNDQRFLQSSNSDVVSTALSTIFLFFLVFGMSASVELRSMKKQITNKRAIGTGLGVQFLLMPLLGYISVVSLTNSGFTYAMALSLLVVMSSPSGAYSNWWCSLFNADLALSVAITTCSTILSVGFLPANLLLYTYAAFGKNSDVMQALDWSSIMGTLGVVMLAILIGLAAGYKWNNPTYHTWVNRFGSLSGLVLISMSFFLSSGTDGATSTFWNQSWPFYIGVAFPCIVGMVLANVISRALHLTPPEMVAVSIESCYQNTGIATSVSIAMFSDVNERAQAVAVPLFYGFVEAVAIGVYCLYAWKVGWTKAPRDESLCVVLTKNYEVLDETEQDDEDEFDEEAPAAADDVADQDKEEGGTTTSSTDGDEFDEEAPPAADQDKTM